MFKKIILGFILIVVCSLGVIADQQIIGGGKFMLGETPCIGEYLVKVRVDNKTEVNDYSLENCTETEKYLWTCKCGDIGPVLVTQPITQNNYDFTVQYYIEEKRIITDNESGLSDNETFNVNVKRTFTVNNIKVVEKIVPPPPSAPLFKLNINTLIIIGGIIFIFIFAILIGGVIYFLATYDKPKENSPLNNKQPFDNSTYELNKLLNKKKK